MVEDADGTRGGADASTLVLTLKKKNRSELNDNCLFVNTVNIHDTVENLRKVMEESNYVLTNKDDKLFIKSIVNDNENYEFRVYEIGGKNFAVRLKPQGADYFDCLKVKKLMRQALASKI